MEGVLRVKDMEEDDTGVYVCKATNGFGSVDVKFLVYVYTREYMLRFDDVCS